MTGQPIALEKRQARLILIQMLAEVKSIVPTDDDALDLWQERKALEMAITALTE